MNEIFLPINVAKLLAGSELNAGFFSKSDKQELLNYSKDLKKLFNKHFSKLVGLGIREDKIFEFSHKAIDSFAKENSLKKEEKPGFFKRTSDHFKKVKEFRNELKELLLNFKEELDGKIVLDLMYEAFLGKSQIKYTPTLDTNSLFKDLMILKDQYIIITVDLMAEIGLEVAEEIFDDLEED